MYKNSFPCENCGKPIYSFTSIPFGKIKGYDYPPDVKYYCLECGNSVVEVYKKIKDTEVND